MIGYWTYLRTVLVLWPVFLFAVAQKGVDREELFEK
jgi:hypothetical protein